MPERIVWAARLESDRFGCSCLLVVSEEAGEEEAAEPDYSPSDSPSLREDRTYWYSLDVTDPTVLARLVPVGRLIKRSPRSRSEGVLNTQSQAGILRLEIELARYEETDTLVATIDVYPVKFDVVAFRSMLDDICRHSLSLALRLSAATAVPLNIFDRPEESGTAQRFFFIRHLLGDTGFQLALEQVTRNPHTRVERELSSRSLVSAKRLDGRSVRALASGRDRVPVPAGHALSRLGSLPRNGVALLPVETLDTSENRFVRFALHEFANALAIVTTACSRSDKLSDRRIAEEAMRLDTQLKATLEHPTFRDLGESSMLPLGSPVLHKRAGYREIFGVWLQFHIAASLSWEGSADVFGAGKRDTDKLYEYWLFFQLLAVLSTELGVAMPRPEDLVSASSDGFSLQLKAGKSFVHQGTTFAGSDPLTVRFSYNRTFSSNADETVAGSWSLTVRPDFTVSLWPAEIDAELAESLHLAVHLHFDAKYRLREVSEQAQELPGSYKREDLFVAHTYRDAIRRSWGAFVIYPGEEDSPTMHRKHREMMPGVGAFPVKPTVNGQPNGMDAIGKLLRQVVRHFGESLAPRERLRNAAWAASGSYGELGGGGLTLVPDSGGCVALSTNVDENRFAIRLSGPAGEKILDMEAWKISGYILVEGEGESSFLLFPIVSSEHEPMKPEAVEPSDSEKPTVPAVIVRLDLQASVRVTPKNPSSIVDLRKFTRTYLGCCATPGILREFAVLS